jgi:hypothetical protein
MMNSVNELLKLFMRQAEREGAKRQPGGARVTDEQELHAVRRNETRSPSAARRTTPGVLRRHAI